MQERTDKTLEFTVPICLPEDFVEEDIWWECEVPALRPTHIPAGNSDENTHWPEGWGFEEDGFRTWRIGGFANVCDDPVAPHQHCATVETRAWYLDYKPGFQPVPIQILDSIVWAKPITEALRIALEPYEIEREERADWGRKGKRREI